MTTYTLTGTTIVTDGTSNTVQFSETATLEIAVRDYLTAFQHGEATGPGLDGLPQVFVEPEIYHVYLNDAPLTGDALPVIGRVLWGIDNRTPVLLVDDGAGSISYFFLGGDPLPRLDTIARAQAFQDQILSYAANDAGLFGPDTDIGFADLECLDDLTENDTLVGDNNGDSLDSGLGNDVIDARGGVDSGYGGSGNDRIFGGAGSDSLYGSAGRDRIYGGEGSTDVIYGGLGSDRLYAEFGNDLVEGGQGDDKLFGGRGQDLLAGQDDDDILSGGFGRDEMSGGEGADRFVFAVGSDRDEITDFSIAEGDRLVLNRTLWAANPTLTVAEIIDLFASDSPLGIRFDFTGGEILLLTGLDNPDSLLTQIDFIG